MSEATTNLDWAALAKTLWQRAQITGNGPHAVVNRCFIHMEVRLFETETEAHAYKSALCCPSCYQKHKYGDITRFAPAQQPTPAPSARIFYRSKSLRRMMLSEE